MHNRKEYFEFAAFTKTCDDAIQIADALLNNDYATFKKFNLKYSKHTAEKMRGIDSLSTYKKTSMICNYASQHSGSICEKCYAEKSIKLYKSALTPALIYNTLLLKYIDIDAQQIPYINNKYFRFESFSDLQGSKHFKNLIQVCKKNKNTIFTLWTKAGYTLKKMMDDENIQKIPSNLNIIVSEFYINKNLIDDEYLNGLQSVINSKNNLKCFAVYDDEEKRKNSNMFLLQFYIIDGCNYSHEYCEKIFNNQKEFDEYESNLNSSMYELQIISKKEL